MKKPKPQRFSETSEVLRYRLPWSFRTFIFFLDFQILFTYVLLKNERLKVIYKPDFNRLRTALLGGQPDRVPLFELGISPVVKEKLSGKPLTSFKDQIEFLTMTGYDFIKISPIIDMNPGKMLPKEGARVSEKTEHATERSWHASGEGMITSISDFEKFRWPRLEEIDFSPFEKVQQYLPDNMKIIGQYGDIFTWVWDFMGFQTFSYALLDNPDLIALMFEKIGSIVYYLFQHIATVDNIGALFYSDDIAINSGLFVSPDVYRSYLFPWMKKIGDLCKKHDLPFIYHTDGKIWKVIDDLQACGVNAIHPIEPQAMNIRELKQQYGKTFCLIGNVDVDLLARGIPEQIEVVVKGLLKDVALGGGYCLGSGNSVPEYAKIENYKAMIDTVHEFGNYPISLA